MQARQARAQRGCLEVCDRLQQQERHVLADDGRRLQESPVLGVEPIDARAQHRLDRGRDVEGGHRVRESIPAALALQRVRVHQRPHRLLEEERTPPPGEQLLERGEAGILAQERIEELARPFRRKDVEPQLGIARAAIRLVLVFRPITHEDVQARGSHGFDETVEQRLGLAVDPVEILDDEE